MYFFRTNVQDNSTEEIDAYIEPSRESAATYFKDGTKVMIFNYGENDSDDDEEEKVG